MRKFAPRASHPGGGLQKPARHLSSSPKSSRVRRALRGCAVFVFIRQTQVSCDSELRSPSWMSLSVNSNRFSGNSGGAPHQANVYRRASSHSQLLNPQKRNKNYDNFLKFCLVDCPRCQRPSLSSCLPRGCFQSLRAREIFQTWFKITDEGKDSGRPGPDRTSTSKSS